MILAIVQARMSSHRLPGKVMREIQGKPMIGHLLERLSLSRRIDKMVLATSTTPENDKMCAYVQKIGVDVCRGSENDVLDRYYQVARIYNPKIIIRITGDCPLIDPKVCDEVIRSFQSENLDYMKTGPTFAEGIDCETFTLKALKKAWEEAELQSEREHVTLYFNNHPNRFKTSTLVNKTDDSRYRFSVDVEADFQVVTAILEHFIRKGKTHFSASDVKAFLDLKDDIFRLNSNIVRNEGLMESLKNDRLLGKRNLARA